MLVKFARTPWAAPFCGLVLAAAACGAMAAETATPYEWRTVPYGAGGYVDGFVYHPREKGVLYTRTDIGGMYRYDYAAKRWIPLFDHLPREDAALMGVLSIAIDPTDPNKVYAACGLYLGEWAGKGAILRSDDKGATWQKTELPIQVGGNADGRGAGERLMVDPADPKTIYYGSNQDGLWKSSDSGASFSRVAASPARSINFVTFDPKTGDLYVAGAEGKGRLFVSQDKGASFQPVAGAPEQLPQRAAFAPDGVMYVTFATGNGANVINPSNAEGGSVWKRDPATGKWREISPIKPNEGPRGGYSGVDVGSDGRVVVSTLDRWWPHDDVFVSKDGGEHWTALSRQARFQASAYPWLEQVHHHMSSWISDLRINPFNPEEMLYGHGGGVWATRNLSAAGTDKPVIFEADIANLEEGAIIQMASPPGGATLLAAMGDTAGAAWDDLNSSPKAGLFRPNSESNWSVDFAGQSPGYVVRTTNSKPFAYISRDGALNWTPLPSSAYKPPGQGEAWRGGPGLITISAKATTLLWAPQKDTAYYSRDAGKTWTASAGWPASRDQSLTPVSDKVTDGVFYVHDREGGRILISVDAGASFKPIVSGLPPTAPWERAQMAITPNRTRDLWLALSSGLMHSRDAGAPFKMVKKVDAAWAVAFGAPKVKDGYPAVYLFGKVNGQSGLWRSDDEGGDWVRVNDDRHQYGDLVAMTGDPLEYGTVYIAPQGRGVIVGRPASTAQAAR